ncbi:hypothetical protein Ancab_007759 [Ancistrocladus abbreviatus]
MKPKIQPHINLSLCCIKVGTHQTTFLYRKMTIVVMRVHMDCAGCESKIRKSLQKLKGVDEVDIDMTMQKVTVTGWADQKKVLKAVRRTGRRAEIWQFDYNPEIRSQTYHHQHYSQYQCGGAVTQYTQPQHCSSYNYYKHGYDGNEYVHGYYYHDMPSHSMLGGGRTGDVFSDENPHGCYIM